MPAFMLEFVQHKCEVVMQEDNRHHNVVGILETYQTESGLSTLNPKSVQASLVNTS